MVFMSDKAVYISPENISRTIGKEAQRNNILAAKIVAEIVKTTLGPKGMDKMIVDSSGNVIVTNDGATILEEMEIDHPAAKIMVEISKTQEKEVGDGTTTVVLLAGKLLERAEILLSRNIHPTVIIKGYRMAAEKANHIISEISLSLSNRTLLEQIAQTAMTGKVAEGNKELLSGLIVKAVDQVSNGKIINLEDIKIQKINGGSIGESELVNGIVLDKERSNSDMPFSVKDSKILLLNSALELKNPEIDTKISVSTPTELENFIKSEEIYMKNIVEKIVVSGANVIFCQKGIDELAQYYLAKAGVLAVRRISLSDMEKLSGATGGRIISNINDISSEQLGKAENVEELIKFDEKLIYVRGCVNPRSVTLVLRGGSSHVIDEIERAVEDGLGVVSSAIKSGKIVAGGGAVEMELSRRLRIFARTLGGREQLAIEEFSAALESIPEALAENAGLDSIDILTELKKRHEGGLYNHGINLFKNEIEDTLAAGIVEPIKVKIQAINSASEVATMILRIDDVLVSKRDLKKEDKFEGID